MNATAPQSKSNSQSRVLFRSALQSRGRSKFWQAATALAVLIVSVPLFADDDFGINGVGSLPNVVQDGDFGEIAPTRVEPSFYVRGPKDLFLHNEVVLDESGTGTSYTMLEERTGLIRREYRGDVYLAVDMRLILSGEVEVGIAAGARNAARFVAEVDGLRSEGSTLPADMALRLPIDALAPRGVLESRFAIETLTSIQQHGLERGKFSMQQSGDLLKIFQDQ